MFKKRYEIQICWPKETGKSKARWSHYYSSIVHRRLSAAREDVEFLNNMQWDYASDEPVFRIWDNVENKVVE